METFCIGEFSPLNAIATPIATIPIDQKIAALSIVVMFPLNLINL
jgi:hypothetical protein